MQHPKDQQHNTIGRTLRAASLLVKYSEVRNTFPFSVFTFPFSVFRSYTTMNICHRILFGWMGFSEEITESFPKKYIIALAPHTSNWDFVVGMLYCHAKGFQCNFLMKKEWFFWPLGPVMRRLGGIPVYRNRHQGMTDIAAQKAMEMDTFRLCITPEGTRKPTTEWKKGFYYIALKANLPILLYGLDYEHRKVKCTRTFMPTGNVERDMDEIKAYYKDMKGRHPEKFKI